MGTDQCENLAELQAGREAVDRAIAAVQSLIVSALRNEIPHAPAKAQTDLTDLTNVIPLRPAE